MEAEIEKQQLNFDMEREQMRLRLNREQTRTSHLQAQVTQLQQQLQSLQLGTSTVSSENRDTSQGNRHSPVPTHQGSPQYSQNTQKLNNKYHPVDTPPHTPPEVRRLTHTNQSDGDVRQCIVPKPHLSSATSASPSIVNRTNTVITTTSHNVADGSGGSGRNIVASSGMVLSSPTGGTTVFTTPSGTRISLNVGPSATSAGSQRVNRGTPPPVPPNKPTGVLTSPNPHAKSQHHFSSRPLPVQHENSFGSRTHPSTKFGITISKDKISISGSTNSDTNATTTTTASLRTLSTSTDATHGTAPSMSKSTQVCVNNGPYS